MLARSHGAAGPVSLVFLNFAWGKKRKLYFVFAVVLFNLFLRFVCVYRTCVCTLVSLCIRNLRSDSCSVC